MENKMYLVFLLLLHAVGTSTEDYEDECYTTNIAIYCDGRKGTFLKSDNDAEKTNIYITHSDMSNITTDDFKKFVNLVVLKIVASNLAFPKNRNLLSELKFLTEIDIENCNVTENIMDVFGDNISMVTLNLSGNKIKVIPVDFFSNHRHLEEIDLKNNKIEYVAIGAFDSLPHLKILQLQNNNIGSSFHPAYLTMTSTLCIVCNNNLDSDVCSSDDKLRCKNNQLWDYISVLAHRIEIKLKNNTMCNIIVGIPYENGTYKSHSVLSDIQECRIDKSGNCFKHESRKMILFDICDITTIGVKNKHSTEAPPISITQKSPNYQDTNINQEGKVFGVNENEIPWINFIVIPVGFTGVIALGMYLKFRAPAGNAPADPEASKALLPDNEEYTSNSPLLIAALKGSLEEVRSLIKQGRSPVERNSHNDTALHLAAKGNHKDVVEFLLACNVNPDVRNSVKDTPLIIAAKENHMEIVNVLLENKANRNAKDLYDTAPIHIAASNGNEQMAYNILDESVNINIFNQEGKTPLFYATVESNVDLVKLLLGLKADPNLAAEDGRTPLHLAAWNGNLDIFKLLLSHKAQVNLKDSKGFLPLHNAARKGHLEVVKIILHHRKTEINAQTLKNDTPLHLAVKGDHPTVVEELLANGADSSFKNARNMTPLDISVEKGNLDCKMKLLQNAVNYNTRPNLTSI